MVPSGSSTMISMVASLETVCSEARLREKKKAEPARAPVFRKLRRCMLSSKRPQVKVWLGGQHEKTFTRSCQPPQPSSSFDQRKIPAQRGLCRLKHGDANQHVIRIERGERQDVDAGLHQRTEDGKKNADRGKPQRRFDRERPPASLARDSRGNHGRLTNNRQLVRGTSDRDQRLRQIAYPCRNRCIMRTSYDGQF